jgi:hypothetical protein
MSSLFIRTEAGTSSQAGRQSRELAGSEAVAFLNELQGLDQVKAELNRLLAFARIVAERKKREIKTEPVSMHMLFVGPPGQARPWWHARSASYSPQSAYCDAVIWSKPTKRR